MGKLIVAALVAGLFVAGPARADCESTKSAIEAKIKKNGVEKFTLEIVSKDAQADGKVVGTCEGDSKKIVYKRG